MTGRRRDVRLLVLLATALVPACGTRVPDSAGGPSPGVGTPRSVSTAVARDPGAAGTVDRTPTPPSGSAAAPSMTAPGGTKAATGAPAAGTAPVKNGGSTAGNGPAPPSSSTGRPGETAPTAPGKTPPAAGGGTTGPSETRSVVVIGTVGTLSGPVGGALVPMIRSVQAWVKYANDTGLVNGHPVEYVVADDGGDPARQRALAQELVERRKVLAFVAMAGVITGEASFEYLSRAGVPVIGSDSGKDYFYDSPTFFPQVPHGYGMYQAAAAGVYEVLPKGTKIATFICVEARVCDETNAYWPKVARAYGIDVAYQARVSLAQPDFTAECLNARQRGVEAVFVNLEGTGVQRVASSCARQGYRPRFLYAAVATTPDQPKDPNLQGAAISFNMPPWFLTSTPGVSEFQAILARYAPGLVPTGTVITGWIAAKLFEAASTRLPEPPTRDALLDGLYALRDNDLNGLTYPLTFTRGRNAPRVVCWWRIAIKDNAYISPDGGTRHCGDPIAP